MTKNPLDQEGRPANGTHAGLAFAFFNEIGIIHQLSSAMLAKALPEGLHPSHFAILNHLFRRGEAQSPAAIASAMQVTKATMTHSLKVLEDRDLIDIQPDPEDARAKKVSLSSAGAAFHRRAVADVTERFAHVIGPSQREAMGRVLEDLTGLRKHLDENR